MFQLLVNAVTLTEENIGGKISPLLIRGWKASSMIWRVPSLDLYYTADINPRASILLLVAGIIQGTFPRYVVPPRPPCMRHCNFGARSRYPSHAGSVHKKLFETKSINLHVRISFVANLSVLISTVCLGNQFLRLSFHLPKFISRKLALIALSVGFGPTISY